ncbi:hypothetical protein P5673_032466, partial [Acropora cervicornis]
MHFKPLRNKVNIAIKKAKVEYYNSFFKKNWGNIKNTWKGINTIFGKIPQPTRIHSLKIGDTIYTTPDEISNRLNHHFCSVGPILANGIPPTNSISPEKICSSGIVHLAISDHSLVFMTLKICYERTGIHRTIESRILKNFNHHHFLNDVAQQPWNRVFSETNPETMQD